MIGKMVELHLLNGKRFLGRVASKDSEGIILYCVPVKALESVPPGAGAFEQIREMLHTVFFPWNQVEYVDIGGEPMGFEHLYYSWFCDIKLEKFFTKITESMAEQEKREHKD
ncbi:hypothetical protein GF373_16735 [bacterium]|nr:hypothetical protein [bacterium]